MSEQRTLEQKVLTLIENLERKPDIPHEKASTPDAMMRWRSVAQLVAVQIFLGELGLGHSIFRPLSRVAEGLIDVSHGKRPSLFQPKSYSSASAEFELRFREITSHLFDAHMAAGYKIDEAKGVVANLLVKNKIRRPEGSERKNKEIAPDTLRRWREEALKIPAYRLRALELSQSHPLWPKDKKSLSLFAEQWIGMIKDDFIERGRL